MRTPSAVLVVDAAVFIAALLGRNDSPILAAADSRALITTDRALEEVRRRVELGLRRPELLDTFDALTADIEVVELSSFASLIGSAEWALVNAVASRNGSMRDAHILALAWSAHADIWSHDRDFAGTGTASWSTPNLLRALEESVAG